MPSNPSHTPPTPDRSDEGTSYFVIYRNHVYQQLYRNGDALQLYALLRNELQLAGDPRQRVFCWAVPRIAQTLGIGVKRVRPAFNYLRDAGLIENAGQSEFRTNCWRLVEPLIATRSKRPYSSAENGPTTTAETATPLVPNRADNSRRVKVEEYKSSSEHSPAAHSSADVVAVINHWQQALNVLDDSPVVAIASHAAGRDIQARLAERYSVADLCCAIDGYLREAERLGCDSDPGRLHASLGFIVGSAKRVDTGIQGFH